MGISTKDEECLLEEEINMYTNHLDEGLEYGKDLEMDNIHTSINNINTKPEYNEQELIGLEKDFKHCIDKITELDLVSSKHLFACYQGLNEIRTIIIKKDNDNNLKKRKITDF